MNNRTFSFGVLSLFIGVLILFMVYTNREALKVKTDKYQIIFRYIVGIAFIIFGTVIIILSFYGLALRFRGDPS